MIGDNYDVEILGSVGGLGLNLYIFASRPMASDITQGTIGEDGMIDFNRIITPGQIYPSPTIHIPHDLCSSFFKGVAKHMKENNIQTETEHELKGKLSAALSHLEDMRSLAFGSLKIKKP